MKSFKILELSSTSRNYRLDERTGYYSLLANNGTIVDGTSMEFTDLLLSDKFIIKKVSISGIEYSIRTVINRNMEGIKQPLPLSITSFKVIKNKLFINDIIPADNISLYVEPKKEEVKKDINGKINNFTELQKIIEASVDPIKLGGKQSKYEIDKGDTLVEFLKKFFTKYNDESNTNFIENGKVQTESGKRRSLGDLYMICKHYYNDINLHDLIKALYIDLPKVFPGLGSLRCRTINKRVWWNYQSPRFDDAIDEFQHDKKWYLDQLAKVPVDIKPKLELTQLNALEVVKSTFKVGSKFKSMSDASKVWKVDSDNFYNGIRSIILICKDGSRKVVYDKASNKLATII